MLGQPRDAPSERFKEAGIPNMFLPSLNNVFNLPNEWEWAFHHEIDNVRYMHSNSSGMYLHARLPRIICSQ